LNMSDLAFPNDSELVEIFDLVGDLREAAARLATSVGPDSRNALAPLLRAMNSYYTNKIEGQHTFPADLEAAIEKNFSKEKDTFRRQQLAIAHMRLEKELEPVAVQSAWSPQFGQEWICRIHRELYAQLPDASLAILDAGGAGSRQAATRCAQGNRGHGRLAPRATSRPAAGPSAPFSVSLWRGRL
jgi:hypothetical protein